jgi:hypothetical protein
MTCFGYLWSKERVLKCAKSAISAISPLLLFRIAVPLPTLEASAAKFRQADFDSRTLSCLHLELVSYIWIGGSHLWHLHRLRIYETRGVAFSELSKLLNQENALSVPRLKHFRNYCGPIKLASPSALYVREGRRRGRRTPVLVIGLILQNYCGFEYLSKTHWSPWKRVTLYVDLLEQMYSFPEDA